MVRVWGRQCSPMLKLLRVHFSCMISSDWCQALWLLAAAAARDISPNAQASVELLRS